MSGKSDELVSLRELSHRTKISEPTLRVWRDEKGMPVYRIAHKNIVRVSEFWAWLACHQIRARH